METLTMWFIPFLVFLVWLAVVVYVISLARRLVYATERIAASLERTTPGDAPRP